MTATAAPASTTTEPNSSRKETAFYLIFGLFTLVMASVPYLIAWNRTPPGHIYSGLIFNIDDCAVYLSWINQAAQGRFFQHSQFTTAPQHDTLFNLFFLLLGQIERLTGLSNVAVYQIGRVVFGGTLLWAVAALLRAGIRDSRARQFAFALVCVSAGFGWLWRGYDSNRGYSQPADLWQPEAITFLSIYFTGLFTAALTMMVVFLIAALKAERSGRVRDAWPAAVAGALLGNFHSYDVIHVFAVWGVYRLASDILARKFQFSRWAALTVAGIATLPTTYWQYRAIQTEEVFRQRALISATWSPEVWWYLLGFGFVFLLALSIVALPKARDMFRDHDALRFFVVWAIVGIAVAYVPVAFQRKMLMGAQLPLCALAGAALAALVSRLSGDFPKIAAAVVIVLTAPSNAFWVTQDLDRLAVNGGSTNHQPYLATDEWNALQWLQTHASLTDAVLSSPDATSHQRFPGYPLMPYLSVYVPAFGGCSIYNGHWSETPNWQEKVSQTLHFFRSTTPDDWRLGLLRSEGIKYVLFDNRLNAAPLVDLHGSPILISDTPYVPVDWSTHPETLPSFLKPVYANSGVTLYQVQ